MLGSRVRESEQQKMSSWKGARRGDRTGGPNGREGVERIRTETLPETLIKGKEDGREDSRTHGDREGERKKGPEAPKEGREGERSRGLNGGRKDLGSLIAVGSLIKYGGPAGPPP